MSKQILFALALNSTPEDVAEVQDAISRFFGVSTDSAGISPAVVAEQQAAPVTTTPAAPAAAPAAGVDTDKNGLPWDERIHSGNHGKNKDGTWRVKKNLDPAVKAQVEAELRGTMSAPAPTTAAVASLPPAPATEAPAPVTPALPTPPAPPAPPVENQAYADFVAFIVSNTHSPSNPGGRLTDDWVKTTLANYGVEGGSLQNLAHRPDMIPVIQSGIAAALGQ